MFTTDNDDHHPVPVPNSRVGHTYFMPRIAKAESLSK